VRNTVISSSTYATTGPSGPEIASSKSAVRVPPDDPSLSFSDQVQERLEYGFWKSEFTNDFNEVRLSRVQGRLNLNLELDRWKLEELYSDWILDDNYLVLRRTETATGEETHIAVKARKRGNDVDAYRIDRRMKALKDAILPFVQSGPGRIRWTNAMYVTGTVDPRAVDCDLEYAWKYLGVWFNEFLARLRKKLTCITVEVQDKDGKAVVREVRTAPKIRFLRSWESHESGWPHFHAILCLEWGVRGQPHWPVFQDKNGRWRVKDKHILEECWPYGFLDAIALTPGTLEKNLENVLWYVSKNLSDMDYRLVSRWPRKRLLTQSMLWYYRKRSYAVSRALLRPSQDDLIKRTSIIQTDLEGNEVLVPEVPAFLYDFVGLVRRKDTELARDDWYKEYSEPPDWLGKCWKPYASRTGVGWASSWLSGGT